ncbi:VCBS domain-containing protein, partial [Qipengyuania sp. 1NDH17]
MDSFDTNNEFADAQDSGNADMGEAQGNAAPAMAVRPGDVILQPDANGVVVLPEGASLENMSAEGRDLVIVLDDGSRVIIPEGAIIVPQIVVDGVTVPAANLAALLTGNEPQPAAGDPQSSGGNFEVDPGNIQDAYAIGNLLPYTELQFPQPEEREIIPYDVEEDPVIVIETPDNPAGAINAIATVDEDGLPARNVDGTDEPEGTREETASEVSSGTIVFSAPDGVDIVSVNGVNIIANGEPAFTLGGTITGDVGFLTITSINVAAGEIGFTFTLTDNLLFETVDGSFEMTVTDIDGDSSVATLQINIIDDNPIARDDTAEVEGGTFGPIYGNVVLSNDEPGADGFQGEDRVTGFANDGGSADPGEVLVGTYGELTIFANGDYEYTRFHNTPGNVSEEFTYTIVDGDDTPSTATLTINIGNARPSITTVPTGEDETVVEEGQLPPTTGTRDDEPEGSSFDGNDETATGVIEFTSLDGVQTVSIGGVEFDPATLLDPTNLPLVVIADDTGTLTITGYTYDDQTGDGTITYVYELTDNTGDPDRTVVTFPIEIVDLDGEPNVESEDLVITIIDDVPTANDDVDSVTEDGPLVADGNVITDREGNGGEDVTGADGAAVTAVDFDGTSYDPGIEFATEFGFLTIFANGEYVYRLDNSNEFVQGLDATESLTEVFTYTLTDGDQDADTATLTITVNGADDGVTINGLTAEGPDLVVDEDDLADGSSPDAAALTQSGQFTVDSPDGLATLSVGGVQVWGAGETYPLEIPGTYGTVRITDVTEVLDANGDVVEAIIDYEYVLAGNTLDHDAAGQDGVSESFAVVASDTDGSPANATLDIDVIDDVPTANDDVDSVTEDGPLVADGNVITDREGNGGEDVTGADGAAVTAVDFDGTSYDPGIEFATEFGFLTIFANGEYVYRLDNSNEFVQGLDATESLTEVFTYTLTDGDQDADTATLTITVNGADDGVTINGLTAEGPDLVVDEDDLADGSSPDAAALTQSGQFTVDSPDGLATLSVGGVQVWGAGETYPLEIPGTYGTVRITDVTEVLDANGDVVEAIIDYEYVLAGNTLDHDAAGQDGVSESFAVVASDTDGSPANATLDIDVIDDVPTANDDTAGQATENTPIVINALENDVFGADGVVTIGNPEDVEVVVTTQGSQGTATYDPATGLFTYTPDAGAGSDGNLTDSFTYTITDQDGDSSTATVTVSLQPDSEPSGATVAAAVDDDGLAGGNPASNTGDLDTGNADETVFSGTLSFDVGNDTPATVSFDASLDGSSVMLGSEMVTYSVTGNTLTASSGRGDIFTVEITDSETGAYTVTLLQNVLHTDGGDENDAFASIDFTVSDSEGEEATATLDITFDDDAPTATDNTNAVTEGDSVGGNLLTDDDGFGVDVNGADGSLTILDVTGSGSSDDGAPFVVTGTYGELTVQADGNYTYQSFANATNMDVTDSFTYRIVDADGDVAEATLDIDITNVAGAVEDDGATVNEAGLSFGSDADSDSERDDDGQITVLNATGTFTYVLTSPATGTYGTLDLNEDTGTYTYTLTSNVDGDSLVPSQGGDNGTNTVTGQESFTYEVYDDLGNFIGSGTIAVSIIDDVPSIDAAVVDGDAVTLTTFDAETVGGTSVAVSTANFSDAFSVASSDYGADGAGTIAWDYGLVIDNATSGLTSDGVPVTLSMNGDVVEGRANGVLVFTVEVNDTTGVVTLTQYEEIDHDLPGSDSDYDSQLEALANGVISLSGTATITDGD